MVRHVLNWAIPPKEKIHEAFSAIADSRITMGINSAKVSSSDYKKDYTVEWEDNVYSSNDNASHWQGYMGYPLIAVLLLQGKIEYNEAIAKHFKGIRWKELNKKHKNNYAKVVAMVLDDMGASGIDIDSINKEIDTIYRRIKSLDIERRKSSLLPPT